MTASKPTPPSGESVSEEPLPDDFEQLLVDEVNVCRRLLNDTVRQGESLQSVLVRVREAKARLEVLEREADDRVSQSVSN